MTARETERLAKSGAVAGLCPITEANLGDGHFNGTAYLTAGGTFGLGTDSNIRISLPEEIRQLEYSQRLRDGTRNALLTAPGSTGEALFARARTGAAQALDRPSGAIAPGHLADLVTLEADHLAFAGLDRSQWLDAWIFAAGPDCVRDLWSAGRACVTDGRHLHRDRIEARYRATMTRLRSRMNG